LILTTVSWITTLSILAAAPSALKLGFGLEGKLTDEEEAAIEAAVDRTFKVALRHDKHLRRQRADARKDSTAGL
jgi:hypothetical protein